MNTNANINAQPGIVQQVAGQVLGQQGLGQQGLGQPGYAQQGLGQPGLAQQGMVQQGMVQQGMVQPGMVQPGYAQQGYNPQMGAQMGTTVLPMQGSFSVAPVTTATVTETVYKPVIVEEVIRTDTIVEVQPVITRHIDQTQINHIQQHVFQPAAAPTAGQVTVAPIVNQVLHPHVVNEIQEVVHKEVAVVQVQKVQEQITEHIVLPTQHTQEVHQNLGVQNMGMPGQVGMQGNIAAGANQGGLYQGATVTPGGKVEMNRDSGMASKLESLSAATDIGRHAQAGGVDPRNGEPIAARGNPVSTALEKAAAGAEAKQDRKTANFIA